MREDVFRGLVLALLAANLALGAWTLNRPLPTSVILQMAAELGKRDAVILVLQSQIQNFKATQNVPQLPVPALPSPPRRKP